MTPLEEAEYGLLVAAERRDNTLCIEGCTAFGYAAPRDIVPHTLRCPYPSANRRLHEAFNALKALRGDPS